MARSGRQGWRTEVCRDRTSSQTDRRQRGGRRTQCEAPISLRGRGDCKGERGVPLYPFTCPEVTFRHEHKVNGTHLPSRIFPSPQPSPRGRGRKPVVDTVMPRKHFPDVTWHRTGVLTSGRHRQPAPVSSSSPRLSASHSSRSSPAVP